MGCGCGSNFSGKSNFIKKEKPCTCGRNQGGSCQCNNNTNRMPDSRWQRPQGLGTNWNSSSSLMGGNVSQAISAPLSASGGRNISYSWRSWRCCRFTMVEKTWRKS